MLTITKGQARRFILAKQGLIGALLCLENKRAGNALNAIDKEE